jgi:hypothetical protein
VALVGIVGLVAGVAYSLNGLTHTSAEVVVPVQLLPGQGSPVQAYDPDQVPIIVAGLPDLVHVHGDATQLALTAWDSTFLEQFLGRADSLLLGLGVAVGAFLLLPLLRSVQSGRPFAAGNAARVGGLAVVVLAVGLGGPFLANLGASLVLQRLGLNGPDAVTTPAGYPSLIPVLLTAALLATLAEAFRRGEQLTADVDGLV